MQNPVCDLRRFGVVRNHQTVWFNYRLDSRSIASTASEFCLSRLPMGAAAGAHSQTDATPKSPPPQANPIGISTVIGDFPDEEGPRFPMQCNWEVKDYRS
jgi:hypothetical protein